MVIYKEQKEQPRSGLREGIQLELTTFLQARDEPATKIVTSQEPIRKITKNHFRVKSLSGNGWYNVRKLEYADIWICDCKNFMHRLVKKDDKRCKHIILVQMSQDTVDRELRLEKLGVSITCPRCNSTKINKSGFRKVQNQINRQLFLCRPCRLRFAIREDG